MNSFIEDLKKLHDKLEDVEYFCCDKLLEILENLFEEYEYFENRSFKTIFFSDDIDQIKEALEDETDMKDMMLLNLDKSRDFFYQVFSLKAPTVFLVSFEKPIPQATIDFLETKEQEFEYYSFFDHYGAVAFPLKNTEELKYQVDSYLDDFVKRNQKVLVKNFKVTLVEEADRLKKSLEEKRFNDEELYVDMEEKIDFLHSELDDFLYTWLSAKSQKYALQAKEIVNDYSEKEYLQSYSEKIYKIQIEQLEVEAEDDASDLKDGLIKKVDVTHQMTKNNELNDLVNSFKDDYNEEDFDLYPEVQRVPLLMIGKVAESIKAFFKFILFSFTDLSKFVLNISVFAIIFFSLSIIPDISNFPFTGKIIFFLWSIIFISIIVFILSNFYLFLNINKIKKLNISKKVLQKLYHLNSESYFYDQLHERYAGLLNKKDEIIHGFISKIKYEYQQRKEDEAELLSYVNDLEEVIKNDFNMIK